MRKKKLKKQPQRQINFSSSCDFLLAWKFFKILETDDLKYLINDDYIPDNYHEILEPIWDKILNEYDKLNGEYSFTNALLDKNADIEELNQYVILNACHELMLLGNEIALKYLAEELDIYIDKISVVSIKKVGSKLRRLRTRLEINRYENKSNIDDQSEGNSFIRSIVQISTILKLQLNKEKMTIAEWIYYNKECKILTNPKDGKRN